MVLTEITLDGHKDFLLLLPLRACQATKTKRPIVVAVTLMDGRTLSLPVDSASTAGEICQALAKKAQLSDTFGFSLYVSMYEKVTTTPDEIFRSPKKPSVPSLRLFFFF